MAKTAVLAFSSLK